MPDPQRHLILGTAGHIDHGKTALVRALTGVDTDRLPEEKRRGITVDLGFAPLVLPGGTRLGVVDVPGHERLVHTMVAGAAGIDLLLLVVAADEGVMPQTREHLAICEVLGIDRAVVALTKMDAADPDVAELARAEVAELLAATALADAPILPVSARTGDGLEALREALAKRAADAPDRTPRSGPPRLPVDRAFEMRGFGTVATGTLVGSALETGDAVALHPGGARARVRGLQVHGESVERAEPGTRCAVNLQGVALEALSRGSVVSAPDALHPTRTLDVRLRWLAGTPLGRDPTSVSLLLGTAERRARVALVGSGELAPGETGFARLHVDGEPVAALPGDRCVLRGFARAELGATLGGGVVLDVDPPHRRRSDPGLARDLAELADLDPARGLVVRVRRAGLAGAERAHLRRVTGLAPDALDAALGDARRTDEIVPAGEHVVAARALDDLASRLGATLDAFHAAEPLRPGMPVETLRTSLPGNVPAAVAEGAIARMVSRGELAREREQVRRPRHRPRLDDADRATCEAVVGVLAAAGLEAPSLRDLLTRLGASAGGEARVRDLLAHLEREGRVVRAPGDVWFDAGAVAALRERVRAHFAHHAELDTPTYKALVGTSRRTAVPLMELLDEERVTVRRGDVRRPGTAGRPPTA